MPKNQIGTYIGGGRWWRHPQLLTLPWDLFREIRAFIHRGMYGYAPCDVWSFDRYLDEVISGGLRTLAETKQSYPPDMTAESWEKFLLEVAKTIEYEHWCEEEMPLFYEDAYKAKTRVLHELVDKWGNIWD